MMPFLRVLTRCYRRPTMLQRNIASLCAQTDEDWEQTLFVDTEGRGIAYSSRTLIDHAPYIEGKYVWILDDDDECIRPDLVAELKRIVEQHNPGVIMLRMEHGGALGVQPDAAHWQRAPVQGHVGCSAFVVRSELWECNIGWWGERYEGDFEFIRQVFKTDPDIYWHDVVASRCQKISHGEPEGCYQ